VALPRAFRRRFVQAKPGQGEWRGNVDIFEGDVTIGPTVVEVAPGAAGGRVAPADRSLGNYNVRKAGALGAGRGGIGASPALTGGGKSRLR
jgi:hypothetical protein